MINFDYITKEDIKEHNTNWPTIPDHSYRILMIGGSGSGKTNALLNLIKQEDDDDYSIINKIYLYAKDPFEAKYKRLIKKLIFLYQKNIRLNYADYFIVKIPNKGELPQITFNHFSDIDSANFITIYKKCTARPYSFLVIDCTVASDILLRFRKNL